MRVKWILYCLLSIIIIIFAGCKIDSKIKQVETDKSTNDNGTISNSEYTLDNNNDLHNDIGNYNDIDEDDIKDLLLYADNLIDNLKKVFTLSDRVIGEYGNTEVLGVVGEYETFDKVKSVLGDYYSDEVLEIELEKRYFTNLYGKIGKICASGENFYYIMNESQISLLIDETDRKVVKMEGFNDNDEIYNIEFTLEKQNSGRWLITKEVDNLYDYNETEKKLYYFDEFSLGASSHLDNYTATNALDNDLQTAWVEGVEDGGIGEWLEFSSTENKEVSGIKIINGYSKSEDLYYANNRVKKISIELPNNVVIEKELNDGMLGYQTVEFGSTVDARSIKITISDLYYGSKYNDTCVSEIKLYR